MKTFAMAVCTFALLAAPSFAEKAEPKAHAMTKEQRESMAAAHEKMAACLRTDKALDECHGELVKSCHDAKGEGACPMMGGMMHGKGHGSMHHGQHHGDQHEDKK
jgi:hypothetical protein